MQGGILLVMALWLASMAVPTGLAQDAEPRGEQGVAVFQSDFAKGVDTNGLWRSTAPLRRGTTPKGARKFLGPFAEHDRVELRLQDLPRHKLLRLRVRLFLIYGHDGNDEYFGPDLWTCQVLGGPTLLRTTFCNVTHLSNLDEQNFPADYPHESFGAATGAAEFGTLGWVKAWGKAQHPVDSVYELEFVFPHEDDEVGFAFFSEFGESELGESWGLGSVSVDVLEQPVAMAEPQMRRIWKELLQGEGATSYAAVWKLAATGAPGLDLVREDLQPSGAAATALTNLVQQLNAPAFRDRRAAGETLIARGSGISSFLAAARKRHWEVPEIRIRLGEILALWQKEGKGLHDPRVRARVSKYLSVVGADELQALLDVDVPIRNP